MLRWYPWAPHHRRQPAIQMSITATPLCYATPQCDMSGAPDSELSAGSLNSDSPCWPRTASAFLSIPLSCLPREDSVSCILLSDQLPLDLRSPLAYRLSQSNYAKITKGRTSCCLLGWSVITALHAEGTLNAKHKSARAWYTRYPSSSWLELKTRTAHANPTYSCRARTDLPSPVGVALLDHRMISAALLQQRFTAGCLQSCQPHLLSQETCRSP